MDISTMLEESGEVIDEDEKKEPPLIVPDHQKTLNEGMKALNPNQSLLLRTGTYEFDEESAEIAAQLDHISIEGEKGAVIVGSVILTSDVGGSFKRILFQAGTKYSEQTSAITLKGKGSWRFDECTVANSEGTYAVRGQGSISLRMENCVVGGTSSEDMSAYGVLITGTGSKLFMSECTIQYCSNRGISCFKTSVVEITKCTIQHCQVAFKPSDRAQLKVTDSAICNNEAIFLAYDSKERVTITNCNVSDNDMFWADKKRPWRLEESENVDGDGNAIKFRDHKDRKESSGDNFDRGVHKSSSDLGPCY